MRLEDLATAGEVAEHVAAVCSPFNEPNHDRSCRKEHLRLRFAFFQPGFRNIPPEPFWHVMNDGNHHHTTLSMRGLKQWRLI